MTESIAPPGHDGYGWTMTDSDRLNARLTRAVEARRAAKERSAPQRANIAAAVQELARRHVTNPRNFQPASDEALAAKEEEIRAEARQRKADIMMSRLPAKYRQARIPTSAQGRAAEAWCNAYRAGSRESLVILGNPGTGKTWLAAAIAQDLMLNPRPVPVTFITVADMLAILRTARPGLDIDLQQFALAPVLVLDDLGLENHTDWTREQLYRLSHARSHEGRPTIVTSNLSGEEIKATYEARTVQRLFGGASLIQMPGESLRRMPF